MRTIHRVLDERRVAAQPAVTHRRDLAKATVLLALTLMTAPSALAHEGGAARVTLHLQKDGSYRLEAKLDPEHLPVGSTIGTTDALAAAFVAGMTLEFDGVRDLPRPAVPPSNAPTRFVTVRFEGRIPAGAKSVQFRDDAPIGEILVEVRNEGVDVPERQWSRAGWDAGPFAVAVAPAVPPVFAIVRTYAALGFRHIMPDGLDHILFVLGLFLASRKLSWLLAQVTAFTVAHSITLGLAMFGWVSLPSSIVEPAIAMSIVFVAVENVLGKETGRARVAIVFGFGLLHGLGFASALREIGLPKSRFIPALLAFNVGVEAGQLTVLAVAVCAIGAWFSRRSWYRARVEVPASIAIAAVGLYWTIERLF
jgi:hypothetical protein